MICGPEASGLWAFLLALKNASFVVFLILRQTVVGVFLIVF
jgi:hypothetical protein